jgi:hypothetical protein
VIGIRDYVYFRLEGNDSYAPNDFFGYALAAQRLFYFICRAARFGEIAALYPVAAFEMRSALGDIRVVGFSDRPARDHTVLKKPAAGFKHDMGRGKDRYAKLDRHFNGLGQRFFAAADDYGRYVQGKCRAHALGIGDPGNEQSAWLGEGQNIAHEIGADTPPHGEYHVFQLASSCSFAWFTSSTASAGMSINRRKRRMLKMPLYAAICLTMPLFQGITQHKSQKSEVRSQKSEVRSRKMRTEVRSKQIQDFGFKIQDRGGRPACLPWVWRMIFGIFYFSFILNSGSWILNSFLIIAAFLLKEICHDA